MNEDIDIDFACKPENYYSLSELFDLYLLKTVPGYDLKLLDISFLDMVKKSIK